jgi:hypothetical protein
MDKNAGRAIVCDFIVSPYAAENMRLPAHFMAFGGEQSIKFATGEVILSGNLSQEVATSVSVDARRP